ncbi:MAG: hypothetical protein JO072_09170 [Parafilimonas sp.]|nr:hypothetical protein [Parafilimonas sp.]
MRFLKKKNTFDTLNQQGLLTTRSELAFKPYEGKIIRHIIINQYKFERTFTDTANRINYFGTRILNSLHNTTKEWAIRQDLFIKENTTVSAYLLADNERYLRTLPYIQDARIIIQPKTGSSDSVDVYVITKDLFSINAVINQATTGKFKARIEDVNLFGAAQSLQTTVLVQKNRVPVTGLGLMYTKFNVAHSFIDASVGYSNINPDLRDGTTDEHAFTFSLQRNLVSQYTHVAGGLLLGDFETFNNYGKPETVFYDYHYHLFDTWLGYNLGVKKYLFDKTKLDRKFVSLRYLNEGFAQTPQQAIDKLIFRFNNKQAVLGQVTFFRQEFYKTNYLYGFGTTEDVPQGYNVAVTGGWYKQAYLSRPYIGIDANQYNYYNKGDIVQYFLRAGTFFNNAQMQDAGFLVGAAGFSRPFEFKNLKIRQYIRFSYARIFNRTGLEPLGLNNTFGIRFFTADSVRGDQRISLHSETISFINYKVFGFKFSPFLFADAAGLSLEKNLQGLPSWYYGLGGGLRARNENLVFRTVEARFVYFPRTAFGMPQFFGRLVVNIQFRYNTNYVREPDIIQYNSDYENNIF